MKTLATVLVLLGVAASAAAQSPAPSLVLPTSTVHGQASSAAPSAALQSSGRSSRAGVHWKGQAGLVFAGGDVGFLLGVGGEGRPFDNKQVELNGDVSLIRVNGDNALYVSGNGLYHFTDADSRVTPFAGAGLGITRSGDTQAFPQIMGGVDFKRTRRPIRVELRFLLPEGDATTILGVGFGFGR